MKSVGKIDWELLGKQKLVLVEMIANGMFIEDDEQSEAMEGILNLLDEMTDEKYFSDKAKKVTEKF